MIVAAVSGPQGWSRRLSGESGDLAEESEMLRQADPGYTITVDVIDRPYQDYTWLLLVSAALLIIVSAGR